MGVGRERRAWIWCGLFVCIGPAPPEAAGVSGEWGVVVYEIGGVKGMGWEKRKT